MQPVIVGNGGVPSGLKPKFHFVLRHAKSLWFVAALVLVIIGGGSYYVVTQYMNQPKKTATKQASPVSQTIQNEQPKTQAGQSTTTANNQQTGQTTTSQNQTKPISNNSSGSNSSGANSGGSSSGGGGSLRSIKIMPLGDSLTQGGVDANLPGQYNMSTINGYRLALKNLLSEFTIDYVGSIQLGDSNLADQDENGFSGACIKVSPCGGGTLYPQTAGWINSENPDLIIMQGGENDFSDHSLTDQQDADNMKAWIQLCWSTKPSVKIIVSGAPWHDTYDGLVHTYVDSLQSQGKAIRWVPYGDAIDRIDGTHPSAAGYTTWANELAPVVQALFPK